MKINITGNNLELTPAIKEYVEMRLGTLNKLLVRFDDSSVRAHVVLARTTNHHNQGDVYQAEINLSIPHRSFVAKSEGSDIRAIFDEAKDKLKHELIKYKEQKISDHS